MTKREFLSGTVKILVLLLALAADITTVELARSMLTSPWVAVAVVALSLVVVFVVLLSSLAPPRRDVGV